MKIRDVMTYPALSIDTEATIETAAKVMQQHNIGSLPIVSAQSGLQGIVTDRDIVVRNVALGSDPKSVKVKDIMTTNVATVTPETDVKAASKLMAEQQVRRLPVVDNGTLLGFVAIGDIAVTGDFNFEASKALTEISIGCHRKR